MDRHQPEDDCRPYGIPTRRKAPQAPLTDTPVVVWVQGGTRWYRCQEIPGGTPFRGILAASAGENSAPRRGELDRHVPGSFTGNVSTMARQAEHGGLDREKPS